MPRPQFSIRTLLWLTLVVAAFLGGIQVGIRVEKERRLNEDEEFEEIIRRSPAPPLPPVLKRKR